MDVLLVPHSLELEADLPQLDLNRLTDAQEPRFYAWLRHLAPQLGDVKYHGRVAAFDLSRWPGDARSCVWMALSLACALKARRHS